MPIPPSVETLCELNVLPPRNLNRCRMYIRAFRPTFRKFHSYGDISCVIVQTGRPVIQAIQPLIRSCEDDPEDDDDDTGIPGRFRAHRQMILGSARPWWPYRPHTNWQARPGGARASRQRTVISSDYYTRGTNSHTLLRRGIKLRRATRCGATPYPSTYTPSEGHTRVSGYARNLGCICGWERHIYICTYLRLRLRCASEPTDSLNYPAKTAYPWICVFVLDEKAKKWRFFGHA